MRIFTILGIMAFLFAVAHATPPDKRASTHFKYSVVVFDHEANRVICEGLITAEKFKEWFKSDFLVSGERIETPKDAIAFGSLILTDGNEVLSMPLYRWSSQKVSFFTCASHAIGKAPKFYVVEQTEEKFYDTIKARLRRSKKPNKPRRDNPYQPFSFDDFT